MPTIIDAEISLPNISTSYKEQKVDWQENNVSLGSHILNRTHHLYNTTPIIESKVVTFSVSGQTTKATILGLTLSEGYYWMRIRGMEGIYKCTKEGTVYTIQIEHNPDNIIFTYNEGDENTTVVNTTTLTTHDTDISISSTNVKQLEEYYIPNTIARTNQVVQSDWDANNSESGSYIKNRTHYIQLVDIIGKQITIGPDENVRFYFNPIVPFVTNETYRFKIGDIVVDITPSGALDNSGGGGGCGVSGDTIYMQWDIRGYQDAPNNETAYLEFTNKQSLYAGKNIELYKPEYVPLDEHFIPNSITRNGDLSTVATSGSYTDLSNTPNIADIADSRIGIHDTDSNAHNRVEGRVGTIEGVIPSEVYDEGNELADRFFVNSTVSTATATFRGNHNIVTDLGLSVSSTHTQIATELGSTIATADKNDYCNVEIPSTSFSEFDGYESFTSIDEYVEKYVIYNGVYTYVTDSNKSSLNLTPGTTIAYLNNLLRVDRYKYVTVEGGTDYWDFEYTYNNSGFTAGQWSTINSGLTTNDAVLIQLLNTSKADKVTNVVNGHLASLDANGNLKDSGKSINDFKLVQQEIIDPTVSGDSITFIDSISQDTNGVITPTKKTVANATPSSDGIGGSAGLMTAVDKEKLNSIADTQVQSDWNQDDTEAVDYIKNKPTIKNGTGTNSIIIGDLNTNKAAGNYSHAEGTSATASGNYGSHAEGNSTTASGDFGAHAEGSVTIASGESSHVEGQGTTAGRKNQHVFGKYNVAETGEATTEGTYVEIVGNGTNAARSNARTLDWQGNEWLAGNIDVEGDAVIKDQHIWYDTTNKCMRITFN